MANIIQINVDNYIHHKLILNDLYKKSSIEQKIRHNITTDSHVTRPNTYIHILQLNSIIIGYIKVSYRQLYHYSQIITDIGNKYIINDFYIVPDYRRKNYGKMLIDHVLQCYNIDISKLCFDKPTNNTLQLLKTKYNSSSYIKEPTSIYIPSMELRLLLDI